MADTNRCEYMHYDQRTIPWPHVRRCEETATTRVHVDGEDKDLCTAHAIEARHWEEVHDWLGVSGVTVGADHLSLDRLMQSQWDARAQRQTPLTDVEWERVKANPVHRASLRILRDELLQRAEDGEFDD